MQSPRRYTYLLAKFAALMILLGWIIKLLPGSGAPVYHSLEENSVRKRPQKATPQVGANAIDNSATKLSVTATMAPENNVDILAPLFEGPRITRNESLLPPTNGRGLTPKLAGMLAYDITQGWDIPHVDETVTGKALVVGSKLYHSGFGVHANSALKFHLDKKFKTFSAVVGLPDYIQRDPEHLNRGTVIFMVLGDGKTLWRSKLLDGDNNSENVTVDVSDTEVLELRVSDAGDGMYDDEACWLDPKLLAK